MKDLERRRVASPLRSQPPSSGSRLAQKEQRASQSQRSLCRVSDKSGTVLLSSPGAQPGHGAALLVSCACRGSGVGSGGLQHGLPLPSWWNPAVLGRVQVSFPPCGVTTSGLPSRPVMERLPPRRDWQVVSYLC